MKAIAAVITTMRAKGMSDSDILDVVEAMTSVQEGTRPAVDEQAERRREKDRHRKARLPRDWAAIRLSIFERDGWACTYCGQRGDASSLHCDHIIPSSKGGGNSNDNLTTACARCNVRKKDRLDWRAVER